MATRPGAAQRPREEKRKRREWRRGATTQFRSSNLRHPWLGLAAGQSGLAPAGYLWGSTRCPATASHSACLSGWPANGRQLAVNRDCMPTAEADRRMPSALWPPLPLIWPSREAHMSTYGLTRAQMSFCARTPVRNKRGLTSAAIVCLVQHSRRSTPFRANGQSAIPGLHRRLFVFSKRVFPLEHGTCISLHTHVMPWQSRFKTARFLIPVMRVG